MINMGCKEEFIDPFCGAGGIVIEGALMNVKNKGSDIDSTMIKRAEANAKAFNLKINLEVLRLLKLTSAKKIDTTDLYN